MEKSGNFYIEEAESDFKRVHKSIILNKDIDCITLGIYVKILVLGKKWQLNIKGLSSCFDISDMKIRKSIALLEKEGYISRKAVQDEKTGKLAGWNYTLHAIPLEESKRTCAGRKNNEEAVYPENRQHGYPTTRLSDNTETGEDNNNKLKENIDLKEYNRLEEQKENKDKSLFEKKDSFQPQIAAEDKVGYTKKRKFEYDLSFVEDDGMREVMRDWLEYKKDNKQGYKNQRALKALYTKIINLSGGSVEKARAIIENSMANNYSGLFELREQYNQPQKPKQKTEEEKRMELLTLPIIDKENGTLADGTFVKNGYRYYHSLRENRACSCAMNAPIRPNDRCEWDAMRGVWYVPREEWSASDEIW